MPNLSDLITPAFLTYPQYKMVDGVNMKLQYFDKINGKTVPVYEPTDEVSEEQALAIMLGEDEQ